jgi:NAD(P)-dependent dehydrogenase (short-subunit alcohol dehydrogenase family)
MTSADEAREVAKAVSDAGGKALPLQADMTKADAVEAVFAKAEEALGRSSSCSPMPAGSSSASAASIRARNSGTRSSP